LPFLINDLGVKNPLFIGLQISTMSVFAAISSSQLKRWLKYLKQKQLIETAFVLYMAALLCFIIFRNPYLFFISSAIYGIGHGINIPSYTSILSNLVPRENLAGFMSLNRSASLLGQASAPFIYGLVYRNFGMYEVFVLGIIMSGLATFITTYMIKQIKLD
jgi:MFS family permease